MEESTTPDVSVKQAFETINNYVAEDLARAHSRFVEGLTAHPTEIHDRSFRYLAEYYDIHGHHYVLLVTGYDRAREWFNPFLENLMDTVITKANELTSGWHYPLNREIFLKTLRGYLIGRCSHWKSEGLKRAREMSAEVPSEISAGNRGEESQVADATEPDSAGTEGEKLRRESPLADRKSQQETQAPEPTISQQLDDAAMRLNISHEELASRIGISRSTYFQVKAGKAGRKATRSTEMYLSRAVKSKSD